MKKRKAPIIPLTVLVVLVLAVAGINAMRAPVGAEHAMTPPEPQPAAQRDLTEAEERAERERVRGAAQSALRQAEKMPPEMRGGPPGGPPGGAPAIQAPRFQPQPPIPSASGTSMQWWQEESGIEKVAEAGN